MPIRAERKALYPADWKLISLAIRERAGWKCEGSPKFSDCRAVHGETHPVTGAKVIITTAHLDHNESNCDPRNLKAWCQRCHNTYDRPHRRINAEATQKRKMEARAGEPPLPNYIRQMGGGA